MTHRRGPWLLLAVLALATPLSACQLTTSGQLDGDGGADDDDDGGGGGGPARAIFEVPRAGVTASGEFYALPFPSDIRRGDDGLVDMTGFEATNLLARYTEAISARLDGFGTNAAVFARFDAAIDVASLPVSPEASLADDAAVYLVDVDPASPGRGQRVPLRLRFAAPPSDFIGANWLAALPYPGFPLREATTYALVVTTRLRGGDGTAIGIAADLATIAAVDVPADPVLARAQARHAPLWAWLDEPGGDERADVASAAVFTTQHVTDIVPKLRAAARALPAPVARTITRLTGRTGYVQYDGVFDAPNFQRGRPPYMAADEGGDLELDGDGNAVVQRMEPLRFSFTIPPADVAMPAGGWPVALYAHGTGGSYHSFERDGTAGRLAAQGIAVISIDQVLHGPRNPEGDPSISFFNPQNPYSARDNTIQGAADDFSLVRLVEGFRFVDGARVIEFDADRIYFFGHSQGGLTGPPFIAFEPAIKGAVLSGAGGLLYLSLLHKTQPFDITGIVAAVIGDPVDEFNPILALMQMWMERSDPINYGPLLVRAPPPGPDGEPGVAKAIYQSEGLIDGFTPPPSIEALATAIGGDHIAPVLQVVEGTALRGRATVATPVTGNLDGTTAVLAQYPAAEGSDGHFVVFDVPAAQVQSARFLGTLAATGQATVVSP